MERLISFETKELLEVDLAQRIAAILRSEIENKGTASLLLSGGSTPKNLYQKLGEIDLDWSYVHVGLVDERFVPQDSPFSNETLIRENLMTGVASNAHFHSMVIDPLNYDDNLQLALTENEVFRNTDVIILGMGDDGHTASLFPNDVLSDEATISTSLMANTTSPNEPSQRITFCGPILQKGKHLFLMITGGKKLEVLSESQEKNYPIDHFIPFIEGIYYTENA
ncbi:MAG: 6-phosphogluconolactonase [Bacteroidota bacterium]|jgi:6-phosphogluconolactonase